MGQLQIAKLDHKAVAVHFSTLTQADPVQVLATACEDGSCILWHWSDGTQIDQLQLPAGLPSHAP